MKKISLKVMAAMVVFSMIGLQAKTYPNNPAGVKVTIPDSWQVSGDAMSLHAQTKDGSVGLSFVVMDSGSLDAAMDALDAELNKIITDFEVDEEAEQITINGMSAVSIDGHGIIEGEEAHVGLMLIQSPTGKIVMVLGAVAAASLSKHEPAIIKIFQSIKPL